MKSTGRTSLRLLMTALVILALVSTVIVMATDNQSLLLLALLFALWAAFIGVILVSRASTALNYSRRRTEELENEQQRSKELVLGRDDTQNRELALENQYLRAMQEQHDDTMHQLRIEITKMRQQLEDISTQQVSLEHENAALLASVRHNQELTAAQPTPPPSAPVKNTEDLTGHPVSDSATVSPLNEAEVSEQLAQAQTPPPVDRGRHGGCSVSSHTQAQEAQESHEDHPPSAIPKPRPQAASSDGAATSGFATGTFRTVPLNGSSEELVEVPLIVEMNDYQGAVSAPTVEKTDVEQPSESRESVGGHEPHGTGKSVSDLIAAQKSQHLTEDSTPVIEDDFVVPTEFPDISESMPRFSSLKTPAPKLPEGILDPEDEILVEQESESGTESSKATPEAPVVDSSAEPLQSARGRRRATASKPTTDQLSVADLLKQQDKK